jgi:hypothetical protein
VGRLVIIDWTSERLRRVTEFRVGKGFLGVMSEWLQNLNWDQGGAV